MLSLPLITMKFTGAKRGRNSGLCYVVVKKCFECMETSCMRNALQLQVLGESLNTKCLLNHYGWANGIVNEMW